MKPKVEFLTGPAGTGKTYELKSRINKPRKKGERRYGTLCATTGIAAVNLAGTDNQGEVTTVNSVLKYFDTESLMESYRTKKLHRALKSVASHGANLCVDEVSMMEAGQLDIIYKVLEEVNEDEHISRRGGLGLILSGDFCQLPPVKGKFAFEGESWGNFANNTTRLTKVWRQTDLEFLKAINYARCGDGENTAAILKGLETDETKIFHQTLDPWFCGTTILPVNKDVDGYNAYRLQKLLGEGKKKFSINSYRWGNQRSEWKLIPEWLELCESSYVMVLINNSPDMDYANGDCGTVLGIGETGTRVYVKLNRGREVCIPKITRSCMQKEAPMGCVQSLDEWESYDEWEETKGAFLDLYDREKEYRRYLDQLTLKFKKPNLPYFDFYEERWVTGQITYMPLRLAYATTVHKSQGLTLDNVQVDISHRFFGQGSMVYVALSRVKSPKGLKIVGGVEGLREQTNVLSEVMRWI